MSKVWVPWDEAPSEVRASVINFTHVELGPSSNELESEIHSSVELELSSEPSSEPPSDVEESYTDTPLATRESNSMRPEENCIFTVLSKLTLPTEISFNPMLRANEPE